MVSHFLVSSISHLFRKIKIFSKMRNRKLFYRLLLTFTPAAADTILRFFEETGASPGDYDRVFTGDLGHYGSELLKNLLEADEFSLDGKHRDCGKLIYDRERQDMHGGGSGCGCVASVLSGYILKKLHFGEWKKVLVIGTGALLSATSAGQGLSIPSVAHLIEIERVF